MVIEKNLPFECCENCDKFVVDVEEQDFLSADGHITRKLFVGCKCAWLCKQLKNQIQEEMKNGNAM